MKHLNVTADDFGSSRAVNMEIERLHRAGLVTHASLMVREAHAADAVAIARRNPALCVGLHLTLCDDDPARAGLRYFFDRRTRPALSAEIRAQFARFREFGLPATYWDGHCHLHLHPTIFRHTLPISAEHGFNFVRLVREPGALALLPWVFQRLSRRAIPPLRKRGIAFADHVFGLRDTGRMTTATFAHLVESLPDGTSEIYFHPGAEPSVLDPAPLLEIIARRAIRLGR